MKAGGVGRGRRRPVGHVAGSRGRAKGREGVVAAPRVPVAVPVAVAAPRLGAPPPRVAALAASVLGRARQARAPLVGGGVERAEAIERRLLRAHASVEVRRVPRAPRGVARGDGTRRCWGPGICDETAEIGERHGGERVHDGGAARAKGRDRVGRAGRRHRARARARARESAEREPPRRGSARFGRLWPPRMARGARRTRVLRPGPGRGDISSTTVRKARFLTANPGSCVRCVEASARRRI